MTIPQSLLCMTILFAATASEGASQVLAGPRGPVEFIGLKRWTAPELLEAIQRIDPDRPLHATLVMAAEMFHSRHDPERVREHVEVVGIDPADLDPIWEQIEAMDGEQDRLLARAILERDESWFSRAAAAVVLVNFSARDATWHDLVSTLIHPEARVQGAAEAVLRGFLKAERHRPVRWNGAWAPLTALLDGTNPFAFQVVLRVLVATEIEPEFGKQLIRGASDLLLAHVGAAHEETRGAAMDLLMMVSGEDLGAEPDAWSEWLSGLPDAF